MKTATLRNRIAVTALAASILFLGACSTDEASDPQEALRTPDTSTEQVSDDKTENPTPAEDDATPEPQGTTAPDNTRSGSWIDIEGSTLERPEAAEEVWGAERTDAGINQAFEFVLWGTATAEMWTAEEREVTDFINIQEFLTAEAWEEFTEAVEARDTTDRAFALIPYANDNGEVRSNGEVIFTTDGLLPEVELSDNPWVEVITDAERYGDEEPRLVVHTPYSFTMNGTYADGTEGSVTINRTTSFVALVPVGDGWAVDDWGAAWEAQ